MLQGNQQNTQIHQIPQYVPNLVQNNSNSLPQVSQSKTLLILKMVEVAEVAIEVEVVEVEVEEEEV